MLNIDQQKALKFTKTWWYSDHQCMTLGGRGGTGKAQPLDEPVLTPDGFKSMGEIIVGSYVITASGKPTKVIAIHPRKNLNMYKVRFSDDTYTICCEDHLWRVQTPKRRFTGSYITTTTKELLKDFNKKGSKGTYRYSVELTKPVEFLAYEFPDYINIWALGYIIGNGHSAKQLSVAVGKQDIEEILGKFTASDYTSYGCYDESTYHIRLTGVLRNFYEAKLKDYKSLDKFIPSNWLHTPIEQRKLLLAGLLDSDGCCNNNRARFSTSSNKLANDFLYLVRSLGGNGYISEVARKDGSNIEYTVCFRTPFNPFSLTRKADKYKVIARDLKNFKCIAHINYIGVSDGQCITVEDDSSLYITRDFTVTHNSYLVNTILQELTNTSPIIIAPTNEALSQIKDKVIGDFEFKTAHDALGLRPIDNAKDLSFEQYSYPAFWDSINLVVADEASMYDEFILDLLIRTGCKILFVGHKSQFSSVVPNRKVTDKCESPVFNRGFPSIELTIPERNKGELWDFNNKLEERIYADRPSMVPLNFDISKKELLYLMEGEERDKIFSGKTKFVLWSNSGVDHYNNKFRKIYYGEEAVNSKYLPGDKIILTKPYTSLELLEKHTEFSLTRLTGVFKKQDINYFYTNSKAEVISCEEKIVKISKSLVIPVYKIIASCQGSVTCFYEPVYSQDHNKISTYFEHKAWDASSKKAKDKAFRERSFVRSCFAHIKHFYAATAHRLQGSSIDSIIMILADMERNPNPVERAKCIYVGGSRAINSLRIYRGIT